jgi:sugar/nucleoside kinase (ribokinase family)
MGKILGMGNALVDIMVRLDNDELLQELNLPKGSMQLVDADFSSKVLDKTVKLESAVASGGSAANTIHGLAKLGLDTGFIGKVGSDNLGRVFTFDLEKSRINPHLKLSENQTGKAIALVSPDSERTFATFLGAAVELSAGDIDSAVFDGYKIFHIEGYLVQNHDLIEKAVKTAKEKGLLVSLDLASFNVVEDNLEFLQRITKEYVDILFANEEEARSFTGKRPDEALNEIADMVDYAIVKIGKDGSMVKYKGEISKFGILGEGAIDTTGAGDLYASGFLFGLVKGYSMKKCAELGALLSGKVVEVLGAKVTEEGWIGIDKHIKKMNKA